jgi:8-oxo-dGTP pyrophosphatase MutT (NUDIX family)
VTELRRAGDPGLEPSDDPHVAISLVHAVPGGAGVDGDRMRILELIGQVAAPADRTTRPGHLTGSAFVVSDDGERAILLFHRKLRRWLQPGGHADGDMNLVHVAWREASEETGIDGLAIDPLPVDLDIHEVRPPSEDPHLHLDVRFLVLAPPRAVLAANDESDAIRWVGRSVFGGMVFEGMELDEMELDAGLRRLAARSFARFDSLR